MERRDYLTKQIDQMAQVLGKILADLLGLKNQGQIGDGIELVSMSLKEQLKYDLEGLLEMPTAEFVQALRNDRQLSNESLERLADIFLTIADNDEHNPARNNILYEKSLVLYEYLERSETTYSMERSKKIARLRNL